jgi:hypothetical protein
MGASLSTFFRQSGIWAIVAFMFFYRFAEAMVNKAVPLFLKDPLTGGGLAFDNSQIGLVKGTIGMIGIICGGIVGGILVIVSRLREIFATLKAGDPFHPENVTRLRVVAGGLVWMEGVRYTVWTLGALLPPQAAPDRPNLSLTAWFSILVVVVLAEVFREGARLRREAELTI